jgi:hypothetical protein
MSKVLLLTEPMKIYEPAKTPRILRPTQAPRIVRDSTQPMLSRNKVSTLESGMHLCGPSSQLAEVAGLKAIVLRKRGAYF